MPLTATAYQLGSRLLAPRFPPGSVVICDNKPRLARQKTVRVERRTPFCQHLFQTSSLAHRGSFRSAHVLHPWKTTVVEIGVLSHAGWRHLLLMRAGIPRRLRRIDGSV